MVQKGGGNEVMGKTAIVIGLDLCHCGPEKGNIFLKRGLDHGLVHLFIHFSHL